MSCGNNNTIGELWGKPVFSVCVSTSRFTHQFMEENDCFTVTHFPESMREGGLSVV